MQNNNIYFNKYNKYNKYNKLLKHYIGDIIYGANDGIVTTFAIVSGVQGAELSYRVLIILGLINLLADGISMGASRFLSIRTKGRVLLRHKTLIDATQHGFVTFLAFVIFGSIPIISFFMPGFEQYQFLITFVISIVTLFMAGSLQYFINKNRWWQNGLEMSVIGGIVALVAYILGYALKTII